MSTPSPNLQIHQHKGAFPSPESRQNRALRFLEHYVERINSVSYDVSYLGYFHPDAVFHDATGVDYFGGAVVWKWIQGLFGGGVFERIEMEIRELLVLEIGGEGREDGGKEWKIYGEWMAHWWVKKTGEKISIPRSMVFT